METITYQPIGIIHSPFKQPKGTPIQPAGARDIEGTIELFPEYAEGLKDLEGFSHVYLLFHFHLSREAHLKVIPYLDQDEHGVFATRSPSRPNHVGLSIVRVDRIEGNRVHIRDVDIVDGTPLLDIKPFVPAFDNREGARSGWLEQHLHKLKDLRDDNRFIR